MITAVLVYGKNVLNVLEKKTPQLFALFSNTAKNKLPMS